MINDNECSILEGEEWRGERKRKKSKREEIGTRMISLKLFEQSAFKYRLEEAVGILCEDGWREHSRNADPRLKLGA